MESPFIERLKQLMANEKENANSLAEKCGLTAAGVYKLLEGKSQPRVATVEKIIAAFPNYSKEWLLGFQGKVVETATNPYRDFAIQKLEQENERLWSLINHLTGGKVLRENFLKALNSARATGKIVEMLIPEAQLGAQRA